MTKKSPRILVLDIETAPILACVWKIWDENIGLNQIVRDSFVLGWSAKWLEEREIFYKDQRFMCDIENDKVIISELADLVNESDYVLTHNGNSFDLPVLRTRMFMHGLKPLAPVGKLDTLIMARRHFRFTSNKLEYLTNIHNKKYKKLAHKKYPGFELWRECLKGNNDAWKEMEKYNKHDVLALEELYLKMAPWDTNTFKLSLDESVVCKCGSRNLQRRGYATTTQSKFQRFQCLECGHWTRSTVSSVKTNRKGISS